MRTQYIPLPESTSGCHFNFLCNLIYADCRLDETYGYYNTDALRGITERRDHGGYCCGIPCIVEMRCGERTSTYPSLHDKLYPANTEDSNTERLLSGKTVTKAGIFCCLGGSSVRERYGLFSTQPQSRLELPKNFLQEPTNLSNQPFGMK